MRHQSVKQQSIVGGSLAVAAALSVLLSDAFGLELVHVTLLGLALGAVVALAGSGSVALRLAALAVGVVVCWFGYGLRAGYLPDTDLGRAVVFAATIAVVTVVAALSAGRLPLWPMLVGVAAVAGAYETTFAANPPLFMTESVVAVTSVLLATLVGFVVAVATAAPQPTADAAENGQSAPKRRALGVAA